MRNKRKYDHSWTDLHHEIFEFVYSSDIKVSSISLQKHFSFKAKKKAIRLVIQDLVNQGELLFTNFFGTTYIERSFSKPTRVGQFLVLAPSHCHIFVKKPDILIQMKSGNAFGYGNHATTRLSLQCIEWVLLNHKQKESFFGLDIGTGSGILSIAMIQMGVRNVVAIDNDPIAIYEAQQNIQVNDLDDKIQIIKTTADLVNGSFNIICSNLRPPTICALAPIIQDLLIHRGYYIISGCKVDDCHDLILFLKTYQLNLIYKMKENGWMGMVFTKGMGL